MRKNQLITERTKKQNKLIPYYKSIINQMINVKEIKKKVIIIMIQVMKNNL